MLRTILSYSVLVLIPAVSLAIAVMPYIFWVKRRARKEQLNNRTIEQSDTQVSGKTSNETGAAETKPAISWPSLWLAFVIGLVGNVIWSAIVINRPTKISDYIFQTDYSGILFAWLFYGLFIAVTPFIFFKLKYHHLIVKQIIYCIIISLFILSLEIGGGIILFFIGWNRLFYAFN